jgi:hypothetical protein
MNGVRIGHILILFYSFSELTIRNGSEFFRDCDTGIAIMPPIVI